jgi:hypothetical protein
MEHPLRTLLYELFIRPLWRLVPRLPERNEEIASSPLEPEEMRRKDVDVDAENLHSITSLLFTVQVSAHPANLGDGNNECYLAQAFATNGTPLNFRCTGPTLAAAFRQLAHTIDTQEFKVAAPPITEHTGNADEPQNPFPGMGA